MPENRFSGVLLLDKPSGLSSHDAVAAVRRIIGQRSVGHTGTLDPLATGLLVLCIGSATKIAGFLSGSDKRYQAEIRLGLTSTTLDAEGVDPNVTAKPIPDLNDKKLLDILSTFEGTIKQTVPLYSAVHVNGKRLYELARRGEMPNLPERTVTITAIRLLSYSEPILKIEVHCQSGTYIRSLADSIGSVIGCGAYLANLKRLKIGDLSLSNALSLEDVEKLEQQGTLNENLLSISKVLRFPHIAVAEQFGRTIHHGPTLKQDDVAKIERPFGAGDHVLLVDNDGSALAIGRAVVSSEQFHGSTEQQIFSYDRVLQ